MVGGEVEDGVVVGVVVVIVGCGALGGRGHATGQIIVIDLLESMTIASLLSYAHVRDIAISISCEF